MAGALATPVLTPCVPKANETIFFKTRLCSFYGRGRCKRGAACQFAHENQELQPVPDLHKTRPCLAFLRVGKCRDGSSCQYAHSRDELRMTSSTPEVDWSSVEEHFVVQPNTFKDKSENSLEAEMPWSRQTTGEGLEDDAFDRQVSGASCWSESLESSSQQGLNVNKVAAMLEACKAPGHTLRKTKMCRFFLLGKCLRGNSCNFAHEAGDLQPHPDLYRTKPCLALVRTGRCRDGDACKYAHSRDEIRTETSTYTSGTVTPSFELMASEEWKANTLEKSYSFDDLSSRLSTTEGTESNADLGRSATFDYSCRSDSEPITEYGGKSDIDTELDGPTYADEETGNVERACAQLRDGSALHGLNIYVRNTFLVFEERKDQNKFGSSVRAHST